MEKQITLFREEEDLNVIVTYKFQGKYVPERRYMSNGDPGYEAEYPELEILSIQDEYGIEVELTNKELESIEDELHQTLKD